MAEPSRPKNIVLNALWAGCAGLTVLVACAGWMLFTNPLGIDGNMSRAQLSCQSIAQAAEAYREHPENRTRQLPGSLRDLITPPFGGGTFLRNNEADLLDSWGNLYQMDRRKTADGREYLLIWTTAPDGMRISQFGFGKKADPRF